MNSVALAAATDSWRDDAWPSAARRFVRSIVLGGQQPGLLLAVGTADHEPWHLTAHLREEAELHGTAELAPTLVRRAVPAAAPPHLRVGMDRLVVAGRGSTILVASPTVADEALLSRVDDARRRGATVLALTTHDPELAGLAQDLLQTGAVGDPTAVPYDMVSHLIGFGLSVPGRPVGRLGRLTRHLTRSA